ncbi:DUF551 domain-containing protein [Pseudoalteromonas marina]|uniref:DUF551 domain-containing protein n=1 Tax=Pseudoalteromonas marina TaxID=267375 RepID=UPI0023F54870|nr:DUF551 domain-containing protein [Pseudoalteromonas marina]
MMEWIDVNKEMPKEAYSHVLVYCEGGNITKSYCISDREQAKSYFTGSYSRKSHGKWSACFGLSWEYGYKVTHWMPLPKPPRG